MFILLLLLMLIGVFYTTVTLRAPNYTPEQAREKLKELAIMLSMDNLIEKTIKNDISAVRLLLQAGLTSDISYQDRPLVSIALDDLNTDLAELLLQHLEKKDQLLVHAIRKNDFKLVKFLIERKVSVESEDEKGRGVLELALMHASEEVAVYLIQNKAGVADVIGMLNRTAEKGWVDFMRQVVGDKVDVNIGDSNDRTPIIYAALGGSVPMAEFLVSKGANVNVQDRYGLSPMMVASGKNSKDVLRYLLKIGADPKIKDKKGRTAYDMACSDFIRDIFKEYDAAK
ncbi:MAG: ankyrin repeat domain-containing protein [Candidatus Wallbacteria bacterium]|nr:ankyrin repeat domain-containing protein [Candidatus Wallbacteria bacterium]